MLKVDIKMISKLQHGLLVLLVIYVAFLSSKGVWFFTSSQVSGVVSLPSQSFVEKTKTQGRALQLPGFHLFGEAGKAAVKKVQQQKAAPKTRLRLMLKGVFTSTQAKESGAIVEEIGKSADYYGVGDTLPGNATLEEVYSDRILLKYNGRLETLFFEDGKKIGGLSKIAKVTKSVSKKKSKNTQGNINTPEQFISEASRRLADNPEKALSSVGLSASADGGYAYMGGNPMLSGMNLKKGDVIRSVNGHPLGDVKKDKELMKSFYDQGSLEVEVMRNGASFYINYPLR